MTTRIQNRRMETAGAVPTLAEILEGELVFNLPDKKLFTRDASNNVFEIGAPYEVSHAVISGIIRDDEVSDPPSGAVGFSYGSTPANGDVVAIDAAGNETGNGGLWIYNTTGLWARAPKWDVGKRYPDGYLIFLYNPDFTIIFRVYNVYSASGVVIGDITFISAVFTVRTGDVTQKTETQYPTATSGALNEVANTLRYKPRFFANDFLIFGNPTALFEAKTDCVGATNDQNFTHTTSGTGAAFSSLAIGADDAVGILRWASGTTATSRCSIASPNFSIIRLSKGLARFVARHRLPVLSDATNTYTTRIGFIDSVTAESADGVFFRYSHGVNGGRWQAVARANNVETLVDTGVLAAVNTWKRFSIEVNPAGTEAKFYIDEMLVATINLNIPIASGRELGYGVFTLRSVGTVSINMADTDYVQVQQVFTTRR